MYLLQRAHVHTYVLRELSRHSNTPSKFRQRSQTYTSPGIMPRLSPLFISRKSAPCKLTQNIHHGIGCQTTVWLGDGDNIGKNDIPGYIESALSMPPRKGMHRYSYPNTPAHRIDKGILIGVLTFCFLYVAGCRLPERLPLLNGWRPNARARCISMPSARQIEPNGSITPAARWAERNNGDDAFRESPAQATYSTSLC